MPALTVPGIKIKSQPSKRRAGLLPLFTGLALGWAFVLMWSVVAMAAMPGSIAWGMLLLASTTAFGVLLTLMSVSLFRDACREYFIEVTASELVLVVTDRFAKQRGTQMILLGDVIYVEYYPYPDSASIILHTAYSNVEIPLWPFGERGQDVVDYLCGCGIKVMNVQFDDKVPG
jgi:hypothetical protein